MMINIQRCAHRLGGLLLWLCGSANVMAADTPKDDASPQAAAQRQVVQQKPTLDRSGKPRKGKASYYGRRFYGKKMASGKAMNPNSNVAASKTLPIGTKAKVTNLKTGKSAVVDIQDRGPYVPGRIVDLSPKTAQDLDIKQDGVAPVEVKPISIPPKESEQK
ncbi:MAG: septal ring lytic transglycosylase RlpA family protein [Pseudomonadota bacterium]